MKRFQILYGCLLVSVLACGSATAVAESPQKGKSKVRLKDVSNVKALRKETIHSWAPMQRLLVKQTQANPQHTVTKSFRTKRVGPNGRVQGAAKATAAVSGSGGGAAMTYTLQNPHLALAIEADTKQNEQVTIQQLTAIDELGREWEALPTGDQTRRVCPDYEAQHSGEAIAYFGKEASKAKKLATIKGTLQIAKVESDEVRFDKIRPGSKKKTKLGTYQISKVDRNQDALSVTIETPTPMSLRKELQVQPAQGPNAKAFVAGARRRASVSRELQDRIHVRFIGSDGKLYAPTNSGPSQEQSHQTRKVEQTSRNRRFGSIAGSSQPTDSTKQVYTLKTPQDVKIVGVRVRVEDRPQNTRKVKFQFKDVALR